MPSLPRSKTMITALAALLVVGSGAQQIYARTNAGNPAIAMVRADTGAAAMAGRFKAALPSVADGTPAYLAGVATPGGSRDLLFLTTKDGHILALDARSGSTVWSHQYGPGACMINGGDTPCYTTSSPAVDPSGRYVYSYGLDGRVHKYATSSGSESVGGGWPEVATLKGLDEKGSSAISIATARNGQSYLYMASGGYPGDRGDYQGHLTTINLRTGAQHVFNADCSDHAVHFVEHPGTPDCAQVQTAIWARPGAVYDAATDRIYVATGNGDFAPASHAWGESVLALNPDGSGANGGPLDSYTPSEYGHLNDTDADIGSTEPAILPTLPSGAHRHLGVQGGKDAMLRLLDMDNLSGQHATGRTGGALQVLPLPQGGDVLTTPAVWTDAHGTIWVFVSTSSGISGLRLVVRGATPRLQPVWQSGAGGFSPAIDRGVLYYAGPGSLWALDAATGRTLRHNGGIGYIHWQSPRVAGGIVYLTDGDNRLSAFAAVGRG